MCCIAGTLAHPGQYYTLPPLRFAAARKRTCRISGRAYTLTSYNNDTKATTRGSRTLHHSSPYSPFFVYNLFAYNRKSCWKGWSTREGNKWIARRGHRAAALAVARIKKDGHVLCAPLARLHALLSNSLTLDRPIQNARRLCHVETCCMLATHAAHPWEQERTRRPTKSLLRDQLSRTTSEMPAIARSPYAVLRPSPEPSQAAPGILGYMHRTALCSWGRIKIELAHTAHLSPV